MTKAVTIEQLIRRIEQLPDDPLLDGDRGWYSSQREHWLAWLADYHTPGAYGRIPRQRDARWVFNHVVNPFMLFWLIEASGVPSGRVAAARQALEQCRRYSARAGAIRREVPWVEVEAALWGGGPTD